MYSLVFVCYHFRVHNLIPLKLKKWKETLFTCTDEMREDFMMSMKKAIVDFVLKDPNTVAIFLFCPIIHFYIRCQTYTLWRVEVRRIAIKYAGQVEQVCSYMS